MLAEELFHHVALHLFLPCSRAIERSYRRFAEPAATAPSVLELLEA